jgi:phenylalanyl-tRNA synthetase alpha chain
MDNLNQIVSEAQSAFAAISDPDALEQVKARFLGKSGQITELLKGLGKLPPEEKKTAGAAINVAKTAVEAALNERREAIRKAALQARLAEEALDVTLPGRAEARGGLHPVTRTLERIESLFASIGFEVADGPEIEEDFHNFTAMNTPEDHPARSMHDTFLSAEPGWHGGRQGAAAYPHQPDPGALHAGARSERYGQQGENREKMPEIRIIAPGRVYRVDSDATHSPMFNQVEGLWVGERAFLCRPQGRHCRFSEELLRDRRPGRFVSARPSSRLPSRRPKSTSLS